VLDEWDPRRGRGGRPWARIKAELFVPGAICYRCREPIEYGLRRNHPRGPSVDHILSLEMGGHPTARENLAVAHFGCNSSKGDGRPKKSTAPRPRSRRW
jgi:5-methylcytosine-specific restriction endonuclease McrA